MRVVKKLIITLYSLISLISIFGMIGEGVNAVQNCKSVLSAICIVIGYSSGILVFAFFMINMLIFVYDLCENKQDK